MYYEIKGKLSGSDTEKTIHVEIGGSVQSKNDAMDYAAMFHNIDEIIYINQVSSKQMSADEDFESKKEQAKTDFNAAADLYRSYVGGAETWEERIKRINRFRRG